MWLVVQGTTAAAKATPSASTTAPRDDRRSRALDAEQQRLTEAAQAERQRGANHHADDADAADLPEHEPANVAGVAPSAMRMPISRNRCAMP